MFFKHALERVLVYSGKRIKNKKNLQKVLCLVNQGMFFCCGDFYEREEEKVQA